MSVAHQFLQNPGALADAVQTFNHLSTQLTDSYTQLEAQVAELNARLIASSQEKLRATQEKTRLANQLSILLELAPAGIVVVDNKNRIDRFNPAAEALFPSLAWGRRWHEVTQETVQFVSDSEWQLNSGGYVNVSCSPIKDAGELLIIQDVTETRRLQQRVERQERLTEMGALVAQLAHQIRTPLSAATLYAGHLANSSLSDGIRQDFAQKLMSGLKQTEQQVADMLAFARGGSYRAEPVDLVSVVRKAGELVSSLIDDSSASLEIKVQIDRAMSMGNAEALVGAVSNILENALQHGGHGVSIELGLNRQSNSFLISISDNGEGIPEATRERIFEPFYTTRERGTGLGLAVVHAVIKDHNGSICCQASATGGARFDILLPSIKSEQSQGKGPRS